MNIFLIAAVSANGMIAERQDQASLDWTSPEDLAFFVEKTKQAGAVVMGRSTFETIGKPLKDRFTVVMTRSPDISKNIPDQLFYTDHSPEKIMEALADKGFDQVAICGGAQVYSAFLKAQLVTDVFLTIEPVLFGKGVPLCEGFDRVPLSLVDTKKLNDSTLLVHYRVTE